MRLLTVRTILMMSLIGLMPLSASALGLGVGAKLGVGSATQDDVDSDLSAFMLVGNFDLVLLAVEGNLGWIRTQLSDDDKSFTDEMSATVLAKFGMPVIPGLVSVDLGLVSTNVLFWCRSRGTGQQIERSANPHPTFFKCLGLSCWLVFMVRCDTITNCRMILKWMEMALTPRRETNFFSCRRDFLGRTS